MRYRADIEGLRAVAVLTIIAFHLNIGLMSGGFIGVDIFFVISGYLISKILYKEIADKKFSFRMFYARRARRILPAVLSVICTCFVVAYIQFYPIEFITYSQSALASIVFSANLYFYSTLNYFSPLANQIVLLHLWSLGVEEQFYIILPFFVLFFATKFPRFLSTAIIVSLLLSLLSSQIVLINHPNAAFYLLPFRAFELLMGCVVALPNIPQVINKKTANLMSMLGFLGIMFTLFTFSQKTRFPGFSALIPCISTALIIWSSENKIAWPNKILTLKPLTIIGKLSYSLYLVHWPVIVFLNRAYSYDSIDNFILLVLVLTFVIAIINYYVIEQRFRKPQNFLLSKKPLSKKFYPFSFSIICLCLLISWTIFYKRSYLEYQNHLINKATAYLKYDAKTSFGPCFQDYDQDPNEFNISACLPHGKNKAILWGDSHAAHLYSGLKAAMEKEGYSLGALSYSACTPFIDFKSEARPFCKRFNEIALAAIIKEKPKILIMSAVWPVELENLAQLEKTIQHIHKHNIGVILLGNSPLFKQSVPILIAEQLKSKKPRVSTPEMLELAFLDKSKKIMEQQLLNRSDVSYIPVMDIICPNNRCPLVASDGTPLYFDIVHLTDAGSHFYSEKLLPEIKKYI